MGRPEKDYWNWHKIRIPVTGDWRTNKHSEIDRYLYAAGGGSTRDYTTWVEKDWPPGKRTRHTYKEIIAHVYCIKKEKDATYIALKYGQ